MDDPPEYISPDVDPPPAYEDPTISASAAAKNPAASNSYSTSLTKPIMHFVQPTDTIQGLALRYNISVQSLRQANNLFASNTLPALATLLIPSATTSHSPLPTPNTFQKTLIKKFQLMTKCIDYDEAVGYMSNHDMNLEKACEVYWADLKWETEQRTQQTVSGPSSSASSGMGFGLGSRFSQGPGVRKFKAKNKD